MNTEEAILKMDFYIDSAASPTIKKVWKKIRHDVVTKHDLTYSAGYTCKKCGAFFLTPNAGKCVVNGEKC